MSLIESTLLLFLVIDPFGNLPFVLAVLGTASSSQYRLTMTREILLAFLVLLVFTLFGNQLLGYLNIEQSSLSVAGGVILFLISLKMIFKSSAEIFEGRYSDNPILVPVAVPSLAGPSAMTTVMILRSQQQVPVENLLLALALVFAVAWLIFMVGRGISNYLGPRGISAMEKLMGLLLNLVAVNMLLQGIREFLQA